MALGRISDRLQRAPSRYANAVDRDAGAAPRPRARDEARGEPVLSREHPAEESEGVVLEAATLLASVADGGAHGAELSEPVRG
jgi:hypothetical protein